MGNNQSRRSSEFTRDNVEHGMHHCLLPPEEDIIVRYIYSGKLVFLRRRIRAITLVWEKNPMSQSVLKSTTAIRYEKQRQLYYFFWTLHPFSMFRVYWENFIMIVLIISLFFFPIQAFYIHESAEWESAKLVIDIIFICDIILTFFTGYFDKNTRRIILRKWNIGVHYIAGLFIFDLLSSVNPRVVFLLVNESSELKYFLKLCNFFKIVRFSTLLRYCDNFRDKYQISTYKCRIAKLCYVGIAAAMWAAAILYFIGIYAEEEFLMDVSGEHFEGLFGFMVCFERVVRLVLLVGCGQKPMNSVLVIIYEILLTVIGAVLNLYTLSQILQIVNKYNACGNKYFQLIQSLQEYASCMRLPSHLRKKIISYFDFKFEKTYFKEMEILSTISTQLQHSIHLHTCRDLLESVEIFRNLPSTLLINIVTYMKSAIFLPSDVIVQAGFDGDSMFFIHTGTVAIYTNFGKEVCHLGEGSHFGEIALVTHDKRVASVIAVDPCELYYLTRKDFRKAIQPYPELFYRIKALAHSRLSDTMKEIEKDRKSTDSEDLLKRKRKVKLCGVPPDRDE